MRVEAIRCSTQCPSRFLLASIEPATKICTLLSRGTQGCISLKRLVLDIECSVETSGKSERQLTACQPPENGCRLSKIRIYRMRIVICAAVLYILPSAGRHHHRRRVRRCGWNRPMCQGQVSQSRCMLCKGQEFCPGHGERWICEGDVCQMGYW
jgi:hypothetical protein